MLRFTDTGKWKDPWFVALSSDHKNALNYFNDECDNAGVIDLAAALASFAITGGGGIIDWDAFIAAAGPERIQKLPNGRYWICSHIAFQLRGPLSPNRNNHPHQFIIRLLVKHGLLEQQAAVERRKFGQTFLTGEVLTKDNTEPAQPGLGLDVKDRKAVAQEIIAHLNAKAGKKHSLESVQSLRLITRALADVGDDQAGILKMIDREVAMARGTKGEEYMQPSTLFGPEKFRERFDKREDPLPPRGNLPAKPARESTPTPTMKVIKI